MELVIISSLVLSVVWVARGLLINALYFCFFMVWNIFLTITPLLAATIIENTNKLGVVGEGAMWLLWLLLLPNAFYLMTEFMHLNQKVVVTKRNKKYERSFEYTRGDPLFVFDSLLLFLSVSLGAVAGALSLEKFYSYLELQFPGVSIVVMAIVMILSAVGVYIGRYGRWNSWDVFLKPRAILRDMVSAIKDNQERRILLVITFTILVFEIISLLVVANYS